MSEIIIGEKQPEYEVKEAEGWENEGGAPVTAGTAEEAPAQELILTKPNELCITALFNDQQIYSPSAPGGPPDRAMFIKVLVENEEAARSIAGLLLNAGAQQLQILMQQQAAVSNKIVTTNQMPNRAQRRQLERLTRRA